jgi:hypothetical protein
MPLAEFLIIHLADKRTMQIKNIVSTRKLCI